MTQLIEDLRNCLRARAHAGRPITYRDLAEAISMPPPHRIHNLTLALEDLMREDHAAQRPLLAALAVSRGAAGIPGRGFFQLLTELGRYEGPDQGPTAQSHYRRELAAAIDYWANCPEKAP
ncbi:MAG: hypothetical protein AAF530_07450 [Pseudomonadota bacterium]